MAVVKCYHCGEENDPEQTGRSCQRCGAGLPMAQTMPSASAPAPPLYDLGRQSGAGEFLKGDSFGTTESPEYQKAKKEVSGALFMVAALQLVCGLVVFGAGGKIFEGAQPELLLVMTVIMLGTAVVFGGLGAWALANPLPPAVIGFSLYVVLAILDIGATMYEGGTPPIGGIVVKLFIASALLKAMQSAINAS
jgi:hypothetical protein